MLWLILGLVLFLGVHSVRIVGDSWRTDFRAKRGENAYKGLYSLLSVAGLVLLVWGFGQARQQPVLLWVPPVGMRHAAALLTLLALVLLAASQIPGNAIKSKLRHPMVLGVKVWAFAHLLSNGMLHDVVLFGAFLVWAVLSFRAARQRDRAGAIVYPAGRLVPTWRPGPSSRSGRTVPG
jgi:uncharacterized membrane protein